VRGANERLQAPLDELGPYLTRLRALKYQAILKLFTRLFLPRTYRILVRLLRYKLTKRTTLRAALQDLLDFCNTAVPYYQRVFQSHQVHGYIDFASLPLLRKGDLHNNFADLVARRGAASVVVGSPPFWLVRTSGSVGTPSTYLKSQADLISNILSLRKIFSEHSVPTAGHLFDLGLHSVGQPIVQPRLIPGFYVVWNFRGYSFDEPALMQECVAIASTARPAIIYGAPSRIAGLARICREMKIDLRPRVVLSTYEHVPAALAQFLGTTFQCPIVNLYGTAETGTLGWSCTAGRIHFDAEWFFVEILKSNGEAAAPGEAGTVVVTALGQRTMPLVRFDTGDRARMPLANCECGGPGPAIENLEGREAAQIMTTAGRRYSPFRVYGLLDALKLEEYQVVQRSASALEVVVSKDATISDGQVEWLRDSICGYVGENMEVVISRGGLFQYSPSGKRNTFVQHVSGPGPG
jgi:phenylacetate-coenzyme A ligase PaaK-like adenylate-forming protein